MAVNTTELEMFVAESVNENVVAATSDEVATFVHTFWYGCPPVAPALEPSSDHPDGAPMLARAPSLSEMCQAIK